MKRTYIKDVQVDEICKISGWIEKIREQKTMMFLVVTDTTGSIQVAIEKDKIAELATDDFDKISRHSVVTIWGKVVSAPCVKLGQIELVPSGIEVESLAEDLPIDEQTAGELKMDFRWIDLRQQKQRLIFQIRTFAEAKMREYFVDRGYIEIHTPKITSQCSEGGAEVFTLDYYGQKAYLTQSPQFYKQMAIASGFDKVFEIGPYYRAEKSFTARHTAEAVCLDFEIAHVKSHHDVIDVEEDWMLYVMRKIKETYGTQIKEIFDVEVKVPTKIPRLKLKEVFQIFRDVYGIETPEEKQLDLDPEAEKLICEYTRDYLDSEFVFITDYPAEARAFYSKKITDDSFDCMGFDMLYRGWEMNSGAVREHRYTQLKQQIEEHGIDSSKMADYLEFFKYGCPTHGGIGFGIDRFISKLLDLQSLKDSIFLFRGPSRLKP